MPARYGYHPIPVFVITGIIVLLALGWVVASHRGTPSRADAHRSVGPIPPAAAPWRSMRLLWRSKVSVDDDTDRRVRDIRCAGGRLYYVGEGEVGCVSTTTGKAYWKRSLRRPGQRRDDSPPERDWRLAVSDRMVVASDSPMYSPPAPPPYRVLAFDTASGKPLWHRAGDEFAEERASLVPGKVLVPMHDGSVVALRESDGGTLWRMPRERLDPSRRENASPVCLGLHGQAGVAQLGGDALVGFRVRDGRLLWRARARQPAGWEGGSERLRVSGGVVYASLSGCEVMAVDLASGRRLWSRSASWGNAPDLEVTRDRIVADFGGTLAACDRTTGATAWFRSAGDCGALLPGTGTPPGGELLLKTSSDPWIGACPRKSLSILSLDTLAAIDPATGHEVWRWQPYEGIEIRQVIAEKDRLLLTDGSELFCAVEGQPEPLPGEPSERRRLAERTVAWLFDDEVRHQSANGSVSLPLSSSEENEARLRLLRLGGDAVPALLQFVRGDLEREDRHLLPPEKVREQREYPLRRGPGSALDLLVDIGDPGAVPELVRMAEQVKNPLSVDSLVEALVRCGDTRAAPLLFRYGCSDDTEARFRRAALYFACRAGSAHDPRQDQVTAYLLAQLRNPGAPSWLRRLAQFELLNDRGAEARAAALATFKQEPTARLLPPVDEDVSCRKDALPTDRLAFSGDPAARDERGTWWTVDSFRYPGHQGLRLWLAQSSDRRKWIRPAFIEDLAGDFDDVRDTRLRCQGYSLLVDLRGEVWRGFNSRLVSRHLVVPVGEVYRDTDGDGLPDRLERLIGTDPANADTNGNGIPDGEDKNPLYRPHPMSDEEEIYQAALEALCQFGRSTGGAPDRYGHFDAAPECLGRSPDPLWLPLPPGSPGIQLLGHPGVLLYAPGTPLAGVLSNEDFGGWSRFVQPASAWTAPGGSEPTEDHGTSRFPTPSRPA
jgi:hypothetical protein